jgi:hypothetical protein
MMFVLPCVTGVVFEELTELWVPCGDKNEVVSLEDGASKGMHRSIDPQHWNAEFVFEDVVLRMWHDLLAQICT